MVRPGWFWVRFWTAGHSLERRSTGSDVPRAAKEVPAPKERGVKRTVKNSTSLNLFKFNAVLSVLSGPVRNPGWKPADVNKINLRCRPTP